MRLRSSRNRVARNGVSASTVTLNRCVAVELSAPLATTVTVAEPVATEVTVSADADRLTVETPGADEDAR